MSPTRAKIRFFCLVQPVAPGSNSLGFDYLKAFDETGLGVLACAIGHGFLMVSPWNKITRLFQGQTAPRFVNVICAPVNFLMGERAAFREDAVYEPKTALSGLFTVGVPNIAITLPRPKPPEASELRALSQYNIVLCPTEADAAALRELGIQQAVWLLPDPESLEALVSELDGLPAHRAKEDQEQ